MTIDKEYFDLGIKKIITKLDHLEKLYQFQNVTVETNLFDNQDICQLLKISKRTLQKYRSEKLLPYQKNGKKIYYLKSDVEQFIALHHIKVTPVR